MCSKLQDVVLLPMFAGTDLGVIASSSIADSSYYVTERLPMSFLTVDQVFSFVESKEELAELLRNAQFCQNIFTLGGVPRWVVEYLLEVKRCWASRGANEDILDVIDASFVTLRGKYMTSNMQGDDIPENNRRLVRLAAFAVSGQMVDPDAMFDGPLTWARLRDSSICLLIPNTSALCSVRVPYALLYDIGSRYKSFGTEAERQFARSLKDLNELVDSSLFVVQPWQAWEMFGACFYAVRINALLLLGHSTVTLGDLLPGAMMTSDTRAITVNLVPSRVIQSADAFGASTPRHISLRQSPLLEKVDWTSGGCIAVNNDGGAGVDIFFALKDAETDQVVVVVDQRKRQFGTFEPSHASDYFDKLSACPDFLVKDDARLVRGVMNCAPSSTLATYEMPHDCFVLSRDKSEQFHGALAYHPASSLRSKSTRRAKQLSKQHSEANGKTSTKSWKKS